MGQKSRSNWRVSYGVLVTVGLACVLIVGLAGDSQAEKAEQKAGGNSKCYVCHATMKEELITTKHLGMDVTCDKCHGESIEHMHDEMLMTKPDLLFGRAQVVGMCGKCHNGHDDPEKVEAFRKEWSGRMRPNGRTIAADSVCTDCHGTHNLAKVEDAQEAAEWITAFNGKDLTGWEASGGLSWSVKAGRILGIPPAAEEGSILWSRAEYEDYLLVVTFRATWPINAGLEVRGGGATPGSKINISQNDRQQVYAGSVTVPNKGLALVNVRSDLVDEGGWNTISAKVEGDRVQVWINGEEVGAVRTGGLTKGRIGLYLGKQDGPNPAEFCVREILIQKLAKSK